MTIINASYDVLSDPEKRRRHDLWIVEREAISAQDTVTSGQTVRTTPSAPAAESIAYNLGQVLAHVFRNWFWYGLASFLVFLWINEKPSTPPPGPKPYQAAPPVSLPAPAKPAYVKPDVAPNGQPWPSAAAYVKGYKRLHTQGLSSVTVDNSQNDSDVFVKLVSLDGPKAYPIRIFYIPALSRFTVNNVNAGSYDVRYRNLSNGGLSRSEAFDLEEISESDGIRFSRMTMTLYKVRHGNMKTYGLDEAEF